MKVRSLLFGMLCMLALGASLVSCSDDDDDSLDDDGSNAASASAFVANGFGGRIGCRSAAVLRVTAVGVVVSEHARLSVSAKPGRLQGVKPPAGIFGRRGGGMFLLCILLFAQ